MIIEVGDKISTEVGGPYVVSRVDESGLIWFKLRNGIGQTAASCVTEIIKAVDLSCEYSGLPSLKSYIK